jgi:hypothetical protein
LGQSCLWNIGRTDCIHQRRRLVVVFKHPASVCQDELGQQELLLSQEVKYHLVVDISLVRNSGLTDAVN